MPSIRIFSPSLIIGVLIPLISSIKALDARVINVPIVRLVSVLVTSELRVVPRRALKILHVITNCFLIIILFLCTVFADSNVTRSNGAVTIVVHNFSGFKPSCDPNIRMNVYG